MRLERVWGKEKRCIHSTRKTLGGVGGPGKGLAGVGGDKGAGRKLQRRPGQALCGGGTE
jgi:hypothetical protein